MRCPHCGTEGRENSAWCPACGTALLPCAAREPLQWWYRPFTLVLAFLTVGPFALPLLWKHPSLARRWKVAVTIVVIVLTIASGIAVERAVRAIGEYYSLLGLL